MNTRYTQFLTALRQALHYLTTNATALGTVPTSGARAALETLTTSIATLAEAQDTHRIQVSGERTNELRLAETLRRKHLRPIVRIARAMLADVPQLSNVSLPPGKGNTTALVSRARGMGDAVQPYAEVFVDSGLAPDFLDRLRTATEQLVQAIESKGEHRTARTRATDAIDKVVKKARHAVGVLDALIRAELDPSDPSLTEWKSALRVIQRPAAIKAPVPTPVPEPVPVPREDGRLVLSDGGSGTEFGTPGQVEREEPAHQAAPVNASSSTSNPARETPAPKEVAPQTDAA